MSNEPVGADLMRYMARLKTGERYGSGGHWIRHRTLTVRFGPRKVMALLSVLRTWGFVESYGAGRNRHHALTAAGLATVPLLESK